MKTVLASYLKSYCLKCRKDTENINRRLSNTSNGRKTMSSICAICGSTKSRFIKDQEAKRTIKQFRCLNTIK